MSSLCMENVNFSTQDVGTTRTHRHTHNTDRQEANLSFISVCFQSLLNILIARPFMKLVCHIEWLLWLDIGTGLAICLACAQANDMITANCTVSLHEGLVSQYNLLHYFWVAKACPAMLEFPNVSLFYAIMMWIADRKILKHVETRNYWTRWKT